MASPKPILALIPARGGSKGVPRKNILPIGGKPLIVWTIEQALASGVCDRVVVSTDDQEIADIAREAGAEVPFMRPAELARDDTPDFPVFAHAVEWLSKNEDWTPDAVVWLRPTSPLRTPDDIRAAVDLLVATGADAVRSVTPVEQHPYWMKTLGEEMRLEAFIPKHDELSHPRRQTLPPAYHLSGLVDVARTSSALKNHALFAGDVRGYVAPAERSRELDHRADIAPILHALETSSEGSWTDLEVVPVTTADAEELSALILGDEKAYSSQFTPFSCDAESLRKLLSLARRDRYWGIRVDGAIACFFMLRGFDEGYERPAFGVYVGQQFAGSGLASLAIQFALSWCKQQKIVSVMLKVDPEHTVARGIYERAGFVFEAICPQTGKHMLVKVFRS